ncbi:MAG TPA: MipA/OmpV family protein [Gammaproteobacteria bacterium]
MLRSALLRVSLLLALLLLAGESRGQEALRPVWEVGAGGYLMSLPDYRGSAGQNFYFFPIPYLVYRGEVFKVDREGLSGLLFETQHLDLDMSLSASPPVKSSNIVARAGMEDLAPTVELGPQITVTFSETARHRFTLHIPWRAVVAVDHSGFEKVGWLTNPILNYDLRDLGPSGGWNLGISGGPIWANRSFHHYYYGVEPAYATATRPAYEAPGGYSGSQLTLALSKRYPKTWFGAFVRLNDMHGTVIDDSPLLENRTTYLVGIGMSWILAESEERVWSEE